MWGTFIELQFIYSRLVFWLTFYSESILKKWNSHFKFGCNGKYYSCLLNWCYDDYCNYPVISYEWGWTAQNLIARQSFAWHFWQQINCSTQNLSTARIQLILAKPDSSKWQKKCQLLDSVEQLTLLSSVTYKLKKSIFNL